MLSTIRFWGRNLLYRATTSRCRRVMRRVRSRLPVHETAEYWNDELSGRMARPNLNGKVSNALRDTVTAQLLHLCGPATRRVLDIGCGYASLAEALAPFGLRRYFGVDLSDYVIDYVRRESSRWPWTYQCMTSFQQSDLRAFKAPGSDVFDVIVFNEVLKYIEVDEAVEQLQRYQRWLAPRGMLCVNITDDPKCRAIFRALNETFTWVYGTVYQQRPDAPHYGLTRSASTPPYLTGLFSPKVEAVREPAPSISVSLPEPLALAA